MKHPDTNRKNTLINFISERGKKVIPSNIPLINYYQINLLLLKRDNELSNDQIMDPTFFGFPISTQTIDRPSDRPTKL